MITEEKRITLELCRKCLRGRELKVFTETVNGKGLTEIAKELDCTIETVRTSRLKATDILSDYVAGMLHIEYLQETIVKLEAEVKAIKTLRGDTNLHPKMIEPISRQDFGERTVNVLDQLLPLGTVADLISTVNRKGYGYISTAKNCGKKTIEEIKEFIEFNGL